MLTLGHFYCHEPLRTGFVIMVAPKCQCGRPLKYITLSFAAEEQHLNSCLPVLGFVCINTFRKKSRSTIAMADTLNLESLMKTKS